jgi:hypothetical protein
MAQNQYVDDLERARFQLREQRRVLAKTLAGGKDARILTKSKDAMEGFVNIQGAIEAIERALEGERNEDATGQPEPAPKVRYGE